MPEADLSSGFVDVSARTLTYTYTRIRSRHELPIILCDEREQRQVRAYTTKSSAPKIIDTAGAIALSVEI